MYAFNLGSICTKAISYTMTLTLNPFSHSMLTTPFFQAQWQAICAQKMNCDWHHYALFSITFSKSAIPLRCISKKPLSVTICPVCKPHEGRMLCPNQSILLHVNPLCQLAIVSSHRTLGRNFLFLFTFETNSSNYLWNWRPSPIKKTCIPRELTLFCSNRIVCHPPQFCATCLGLSNTPIQYQISEWMNGFNRSQLHECI